MGTDRSKSFASPGSNGLLKILILQTLKDVYAAFYGRRHHWKRHDTHEKDVSSTRSALTIINEKYDFPKFEQINNKAPVSPVFLLSAGWRSGSTLVQRLINSSPGTLMWGEPYADSGLLLHPAEQIRKFTRNWPYDGTILSANRSAASLSTEWVANMYPGVDTLRCAYREFFDTLFQPALDYGDFSRWGIKDVKLSADDGYFLQWIYPDARFLFLVRDPIDAYISYAPHRPWYVKRPETPIITAKQFAVLWQRLAQSFIDHHDSLGGMLIRYEDLLARREIVTEIEQHLNLQFDHSVLDSKVNPKTANKRERYKLLPFERKILRNHCEPTYSELGYH